MIEDSLYEETAESRARNKVILWWMLHLAHIEEGEKEKNFLVKEVSIKSWNVMTKLMKERTFLISGGP